MSSDDRTRRRRQADDADALDRAHQPGADGAPAYIGQVYNGGALPTTVPKFFLTRPLSLSGNESENAVPTITADTSLSVPVLVLGPRVPVAGDNLIARLVDGRWVAGMGAPSGTPPITIPTCLCTTVPVLLDMVVVNNGGEPQTFNSATLRYQAVPAAYNGLFLGYSSGGTRFTWLSDESFSDGTDTYRYNFECFFGQYSLSRVYVTSLFGSPFEDITRYSWLTSAPNTCIPFALTAGTVYPGGSPATDIDVFDGT